MVIEVVESQNVSSLYRKIVTKLHPSMKYFVVLPLQNLKTLHHQTNNRLSTVILIVFAQISCET